MANYRYPQQIEFMDKLPKTPTGKFLRRELRDEARAKVKKGAEYNRQHWGRTAST